MVVKIQKNHFIFSFNNLENKYKGFIDMNSSQSFHMLERFVMLRIFQYFAHLFQNYLELLLFFLLPFQAACWSRNCIKAWHQISFQNLNWKQYLLFLLIQAFGYTLAWHDADRYLYPLWFLRWILFLFRDGFQCQNPKPYTHLWPDIILWCYFTKA